jgi:hypothetical protein
MSRTNLERLPELHAAMAAREANLRDIVGAFRDKVKALREAKDPETGKSVAEMIAAEQKAIKSLDAEIVQAWKFPHQTNLDGI